MFDINDHFDPIVNLLIIIYYYMIQCTRYNLYIFMHFFEGQIYSQNWKIIEIYFNNLSKFL